VLLADDQEMVRHSLATFLALFDDLQLVGEASNGVEALRLCAEHQPDVVLMDLVMPEMDGIAATHAIRQKNKAIQVVALTSFQDEDRIQAVLEGGAIDYLLKNVSIDELSETIRKAARLTGKYKIEDTPGLEQKHPERHNCNPKFSSNESAKTNL